MLRKHVKIIKALTILEASGFGMKKIINNNVEYVDQAAGKKLKSELSSDSREVMQVALPATFGHPSPTQKRGTDLDIV